MSIQSTEIKQPTWTNPWVVSGLVKPNKAITSSTVARWLKCAGIDTSVLNAHSVRGVSSTMAANLGITTNDILKAADWSMESVFLYKSMDNPSFGRVVFSARESAQ